MVLGVSALLFASVISGAISAVVGEFFESVLLRGRVVWQVANFGISLAVISLLIAVVFKVVPEVVIKWTDVLLECDVIA
jgi:membrane protein